MEEDKNPVGNEHPLRGLLYGFALLLTAAAVVASCCCAGCASAPQLPTGAVAFVTNSLQRAVAQLQKTLERDALQAAFAPKEAQPLRETLLVWRYGGFHGEGASEDPANVIADLRIDGNALSYRWVKGDLSNWGVGETDATAIAAAFYWEESEHKWIGGKFEWVDHSRTVRHLGNLDGYNGWQRAPFDNAPRRAFCIVSKDGRKRTNLVEEGK